MVVLTGAYLEIAVVSIDDSGTEPVETETVLSQTTEDVEIERDTDDADWNEHNNPRTQRRELFASVDLTFEMILTDGLQNLQDAGVLDANGRVQRNVNHDRVDIHVYENPGDSTPAATYQCENTQFKYEVTNLPLDGPGTAEVTGWINGEHGWDITA